MKRILKYASFLENNNFNSDEIANLFYQRGIQEFYQKLLENENGVIIYNGSLNLAGIFQDKVDLPTQIDIVYGNLCLDNNKLKSLEGCPTEIKAKIGNSNFSANNNNLTNLEGGPIQVDGDYDVINCGLTSLVGSPRICKGDFCANGNKLEDFTGLSEMILDGDIYLVNNPLYSFRGLPEFIKNKIYIRNTPLYEVWNLMSMNQYALQLSISYPFIGKIDNKWMINSVQFEDVCSESGVNLPSDWRDSIKNYELIEA